MDISQYASPAIQDALAGTRPFIGATRACPDCRRPQHYTGLEYGWAHDAGWYHDSPADMWHCADPRKAGA